jgi:2'-5' RNA ligase
MSAAVRRQAQMLIHELAARTAAVKWVSPEQLHLTLKFLGDVNDKDLYGVCRAVDRAVLELRPFEVICQGVGAFPDVDRPRTLWLGLKDPAGRLVQLQQHMEAEFASLGFSRDVRSFYPHVTVGRVDIRHRRLGRLADELERHVDKQWGLVPVKRCTVYTSELRPGGPVHTPIGHSTLGNPSS